MLRSLPFVLELWGALQDFKYHQINIFHVHSLLLASLLFPTGFSVFLTHAFLPALATHFGI